MYSVSQASDLRNPRPFGSFLRVPPQLLRAIGDKMSAPGVRVLVDHVVAVLASVTLEEQAAGVFLTVRGLADALNRQPTQIQRAIHGAMTQGILVRRPDGQGWRYQIAQQETAPIRLNTGLFSRWDTPLAYVPAMGERMSAAPSPGLSTGAPRGVHTEEHSPARPRSSYRASEISTSKDSEESREKREKIDLWYVWTAHPKTGRRIPLVWIVAELLKASFGPGWSSEKAPPSAELCAALAMELSRRDISPAQWTLPVIRMAIVRARETAQRIEEDRAELAAAELAAAELAAAKRREALAAELIRELESSARFRRDVAKLRAGDFAELELLAALVASGDLWQLEELGSSVRRFAEPQIGREAPQGTMTGHAADPVLGNATIRGFGGEASAQAVTGPKPGAELSPHSQAPDDPGNAAVIDCPRAQPIGCPEKAPEDRATEEQAPLKLLDCAPPRSESCEGTELRMAYSSPNPDQRPAPLLVGFGPADREKRCVAVQVHHVSPQQARELGAAESASPADQDQRAVTNPSGRAIASRDQARELGNPDRARLNGCSGICASQPSDHWADVGESIPGSRASSFEPGDMARDRGVAAPAVRELTQPGADQHRAYRPGCRSPRHAPGRPGVDAGSILAPGFGCSARKDSGFDPGELARVKEQIRAWRKGLLGIA